MAADGAMLEARAVCAWRGERQVLDDISLAIRSGEFLQVLGPNGSGKSTLLRILCGLLPPDSGSVTWRSAAISTTNERFLAELAYIGHLNALKPDLTAFENLDYLLGFRTRVTAGQCSAALARIAAGTVSAACVSSGMARRAPSESACTPSPASGSRQLSGLWSARQLATSPVRSADTPAQ